MRARSAVIAAMLSVGVGLCLVPGAAAENATLDGEAIAIVVDGPPGSNVHEESMAVQTRAGLFPISGESVAARNGARVSGTVDPRTGTFTITESATVRDSLAATGLTLLDVTVVQAQWSDERRVKGDAEATGAVITDSVAPYWSGMTADRIQLTVRGTQSLVLPGMKPTDCNFDSLYQPVEDALPDLFNEPSSIVVIVTEHEDCAWWGAALRPSALAYAGGVVILNGNGTNAPLMVHETGHSLSLGHAASQFCTDGDGLWTSDSEQCSVSEYGDAFDPMGLTSSIDTPVSPLMMQQLESLDLLDPIVDDGSAGSQTHVIQSRWSTSGNRAVEVYDANQPDGWPRRPTYFLEYRPAADPQAAPNASCFPGVLIRRLPPFEGGIQSRLLPSSPSTPRGFLPGSGVTLTDGETHISVLTADPDSATIRVDRHFSDTIAADTTSPDDFQIQLHSDTNPDGVAYDTGNSWLTWPDTTDRGGSGMAYYDILVDGRPAGTVYPGDRFCDGRLSTDVFPPPGTHQYSVRATDFAGNTTTSNTVTLLADRTAPIFTKPLRAHLTLGDIDKRGRRGLDYTAAIDLTWSLDDGLDGVGMSSSGWFTRQPRRGHPIDTSTGHRTSVFRWYDDDSFHGYEMQAEDLARNQATSGLRAQGRLIPEGRMDTSRGWRVRAAESAIGSSRLVASSPGDHATLSLHGGQYGIVAKRGPRQGSIAVSLDGSPSLLIDLTARRSHPRAIVWVSPRHADRGSTLTLTVVGPGDVGLDNILRLRNNTS